MNILGVCNSKDASACLLVDGNLISAVGEERFNRQKLTSEFPWRAIEWIMTQNTLTLGELDAIGVGVWEGLNSTEMLPGYFEEAMNRVGSAESNRHANEIALGLSARFSGSIKSDRIQSDALRTGLCENGFSDIPVIGTNHHEAHALTAFEFSPFDRALTITLDGRGDFLSGTASIRERGLIAKTLRREFEFDSLGAIYGWITSYLGFTPDRHEGKVTGLSATGNPDVCRHVFDKMATVKDGQIRSNLGPYYMPYMRAKMPKLEAELSRYSREDVAAGVQSFVEDAVVDYVRHFLRLTGERNLAVAGGLFANVMINLRLREIPELDELFVFPNMGDGGISVGGAAHASAQLGVPANPMANMYLGPQVAAIEIANIASDASLQVSEPVDLASEVAEILASGSIVGLAACAMEFGPRALGSRSILASPKNTQITAELNLRLKRSDFMPFAPVVRKERATECFENWSENDACTPYMTTCLRCTDLLANSAPAVVHVDGTARPQTISRSDNPVYYDILYAFEKKTGIPALINTSFNVHEEPIVLGLADALQVLKSKSIDILVVQPYIIRLSHFSNCSASETD